MSSTPVSASTSVSRLETCDHSSTSSSTARTSVICVDWIPLLLLERPSTFCHRLPVAKERLHFMGRELSTGDTVLLVGTKRGLYLLSSPDRETWTCETPFLGGRRIFSGVLDQRAGARLFAAENGDFFGSFVRYSDDFGHTWQEPERGIAFAEDSGESLKNIWTIVPGRPDQPEVVYAGVDPASLWVSLDGGITW